MSPTEAEAAQPATSKENAKELLRAIRDHFPWPQIVTLGLLLLAVITAYELAPPAETLPEYARLLHTPVQSMVTLVLLVLVMSGLIRAALRGRLDVAHYVAPLLGVVLVEPVVRLAGTNIDAAVRAGLANPAGAVAVGAAAALLYVGWRIGCATAGAAKEVGTVEAYGVAVSSAKEMSDEDVSELDGYEPGWSEACAASPYRYWITYAFQHAEASGIGHVDVARQMPISCGYDVQGTAECIRQDLKRQHPTWRNLRLNITSWQRYEAPLPGGGGREDLPEPTLPKNVLAFRRPS